MASSLWLRIKLIVGLVLFMAAVHVANTALDGQLNRFGIVPGVPGGWLHIFTAPFLHGSDGHLLNNLVGLSVFSAFCLLRSVRFFLLSSLFIIGFSGLLIWLFGRPGSHIGASGWIFGLWSLSIAMGFFDRRLKNIIIALVVVFLYGGMIYGVLPSDPGVSYEAHIFGVIAGVMCAFLYRVFSPGRDDNTEEPTD
jgi:membrane associated rhomboid family serine protease